MIIFTEEMKGRDEERESALSWARNANNVTDEKLLAAYQAGFETGWSKARQFFVLKGELKVNLYK
jgi:hypothetical protein